jgi:molecular chaperone GrpE (heat shock protein)
MSDEKPNSEAEAKPEETKAGNGADPAAEAAAWKAKADEYLELARRAKADFINYQDRVRRDKADWNRQSLEGFVRELLPALDGFSMAKFEDPKLLEAVRLLEKEFLRVLAKTGVTPDRDGRGSVRPAVSRRGGDGAGGHAARGSPARLALRRQRCCGRHPSG